MLRFTKRSNESRLVSNSVCVALSIGARSGAKWQEWPRPGWHEAGQRCHTNAKCAERGEREGDRGSYL